MAADKTIKIPESTSFTKCPMKYKRIDFLNIVNWIFGASWSCFNLLVDLSCLF